MFSFRDGVIIEDFYKKIKEFVSNLLPGSILNSEFNGNFIYLVRFSPENNKQIPRANLEISQIFEEIEKRKDENFIADWGISQSTLEDVFLEIVAKSDLYEN